MGTTPQAKEKTGDRPWHDFRNADEVFSRLPKFLPAVQQALHAVIAEPDNVLTLARFVNTSDHLRQIPGCAEYEGSIGSRLSGLGASFEAALSIYAPYNSETKHVDPDLMEDEALAIVEDRREELVSAVDEASDRSFALVGFALGFDDEGVDVPSMTAADLQPPVLAAISYYADRRHFLEDPGF